MVGVGGWWGAIRTREGGEGSGGVVAGALIRPTPQRSEFFPFLTLPSFHYIILTLPTELLMLQLN